MKKVSIIVSVYNGEKFVDEFFDIILRQTYKNTELLFVVDRKTNDRTVEKIQENAPKFGDVRIVYQEGNGRLGEARNIGLQNAVGDLLWSTDIDDEPIPTFLEEMVRIQEENNADSVFCNYIRSEGMRDKVDLDRKYKVRVMDQTEALQARRRGQIPLTAWSMVIKKELIRDKGLQFILGGVIEDDDFTYKVLAASDVVCYYNKPLYYYKFDPEADWRRFPDFESKKRIAFELISYLREQAPGFADEYARSWVKMCMHESARFGRKMFFRLRKDKWFICQLEKYYAKKDLETVLYIFASPLYYLVVRSLVTMKYRDKPLFDTDI
ncbi:MAG: glycosyltransferase [Candidatus Methanoplasma sp.]|nr:glycosyltransferase [Candidatus Methanoplasma sp.]